MKSLLGAQNVLEAPEDLILYEFDGSVEKGRPDLVVFPHTTEQVSKIVKLAVRDKIGQPAVVDLEKKLKFTSEGTQAKLTLRLTPQEFEKNAQIFAASHKQPATGIADIRPVVKPAPAPPPPPERKVIRIEGLDSGPREIPYKDQ